MKPNPEPTNKKTAYKESWRWLYFYSIIASPVVMAVMMLFEASGSANFNSTTGFLFCFFLALSVFAFLFGPIILPWVTYVAVENILLGLSDDHMYFLCCTTKNRAEQGLLEVGMVVAFPPALMCCIALVRIVFRRNISITAAALLVAAGIAGSHLALKYFHHLENTVNCSELQCYS